MSGHYYYFFTFRVRPEAVAELAVLAAVARGVAPERADLDRIHPVPRHLLVHPRSMLDEEAEPWIGSPVRLAGTGDGDQRLSIEFCLHDDTYANFGYMFEVWLLSLVREPRYGELVIGHQSLYRGERLAPITWTERGFVEEGGSLLEHSEVASLQQHHEEWEDYPFW